MRGVKKLLERVSQSTDEDFVRSKAWMLHEASDIAALNDDDREWRQLCDAECKCLERLKEIKGKKVVK